MVDTSQHSYSETEVEQALEELEPKVRLDGIELESELSQLLNYQVELQEAKESIVKQHGREYAQSDTYERFDSWPIDSRPPAIDSNSWIRFDDSDGYRELGEAGNALTHGFDYTVYILECELLGPNLRTIERRATELFGERPEWVRRAYESERAFYIGQTAALGNRLQTHATGTLSETPPPAKLARLSDVRAVGVPFRKNSREDAKEFEQAYAENLRDVTEDNDSVFVHFR